MTAVVVRLVAMTVGLLGAGLRVGMTGARRVGMTGRLGSRVGSGPDRAVMTG
jgi:hypothetical protein